MRVRRIFASVTLLGVCAAPAQAQTFGPITWKTNSSICQILSYWSNPLCWTYANPYWAAILPLPTPGPGDDLWIFGGTLGHTVWIGSELNPADVTVASANSIKLGAGGFVTLYAGSSLTTQNETIGHIGNGTFTQQGGNHSVAGAIVFGNQANDHGVYTLNHGYLRVSVISQAQGATSTLNLNGGSFELTGGVLGVQNLNVGKVSTRASGAVAKGLWLNNAVVAAGDVRFTGGPDHPLVLNSGFLSTTQANITNNTTLLHNGGSHVNGTMTIAEAGVNDAGAYKLVGGTLRSTRQDIGLSGQGSFEQLGGTNTVSLLIIGNGPVAKGTYSQAGGSLVSDKTYVGLRGFATFNQSAGVHTVNDLYVGYRSEDYSKGTYILSGGELKANNISLADYEGSTGEFHHTGGTNTVVGDLKLGGSSARATGTYTLGGTGVLNVARIRGGGEGDGTLTLNGGTLNFDSIWRGAGQLTVIIDGGQFNQRSGTSINPTALTIGEARGSNAAFTLDANKSITADRVTVGRSGVGSFDQYGTQTLGSLDLGVSRQGRGTFTLHSPGKLTVAKANIGGDALDRGVGAFVQTGGSANFTDTLHIRSGSSYELRGGLLTVKDEYMTGLRGATQFVQWGGGHYVENLYLAWGGDGSYDLYGGFLIVTNLINGGAGDFRFNLNGGHLTVQGDTVNINRFNIGTAIGSNVDFTLGGGKTSRVDYLTVGGAEGSRGGYNLEDAALTTSRLTIGGGGGGGGETGSFAQSAGTLSVTYMTINPQGSYVQTGGALTVDQPVNNSGHLRLAGGTASLNAVNNSDTGRIEIASGVQVFRGAVVNNGKVTVENSNVTFMAGHTENGSFVSDSSTVHFNGLVVGTTGYVVAGAGDKFVVSGAFVNNSLQAALWDTRSASLNLNDSDWQDIYLASADLGDLPGSFENNFAWGTFAMASGARVRLLDGNAVSGAALYVGVLALGGGTAQLADIHSPFNIYYDAGLPDNAYLSGQSFVLAGGGSLMAAAVPEPATWLLTILGGLAVGALSRRRSRPSLRNGLGARPQMQSYSD